MTDKQFNALQAQLTQINEKLIDHDKRFDAQAEEFDKRLNTLDGNIGTLYTHTEERFEGLEKHLDMKLGLFQSARSYSLPDQTVT